MGGALGSRLAQSQVHSCSPASARRTRRCRTERASLFTRSVDGKTGVARIIDIAVESLQEGRDGAELESDRPAGRDGRDGCPGRRPAPRARRVRPAPSGPAGAAGLRERRVSRPRRAATGPQGLTGSQGPAGPSGGGGGSSLPNKQTVGTAAVEAIGTLSLLSYQWNVSTPTDPNTGQASGKVNPSPFKFVKAIDGTSAKLFRAAVTNEVLQTVDVTVFAPGSNGETLETMKFEDARLPVGPRPTRAPSVTSRSRESRSSTGRQPRPPAA